MPHCPLCYRPTTAASDCDNCYYYAMIAPMESRKCKRDEF